MQALEDSEILWICKTEKEALYKQLPIVEKLFRVISQKAVTAWQKRLIQNHYLTVKECYFYFTETYHTIIYKLNDLQIASYIGITHEFLSKIKKQT